MHPPVSLNAHSSLGTEAAQRSSSLPAKAANVGLTPCASNPLAANFLGALLNISWWSIAKAAIVPCHLSKGNPSKTLPEQRHDERAGAGNQAAAGALPSQAQLLDQLVMLASPDGRRHPLFGRLVGVVAVKHLLSLLSFILVGPVPALK
jgi:hypothetical protein